jgi:hypothetical protein
MKRHFPPKDELGADQYIPTIVGSFYLANPPFLVSNYVFIHDFCLSLPDTKFQSDAMHPFSALTKIVEKLKGFRRKELCRTPCDQ